MATQVQRRRGTTLEHSSFTGAQGEVTFDTDLNCDVYHSGTKARWDKTQWDTRDNLVSFLQTVISKIDIGNIFTTSGVSTEGDAPARTWQIKNSAHTANGGTILTISGNYHIEMIVWDGDARDFGVKADGITDDTAAIKAAIQAAIDNQVTVSTGVSGKSIIEVLLPVGECVISGEIIPANTGNARHTVRLKGQKTILDCATCTTIPIQRVGYMWQIDGIIFDGYSTAIDIQTNSADSGTDTNLITISNCEFKQQTGFAVTVSDVVAQSESYNITFVNCKFFNNISTGKIAQLRSGDMFTFYSCWFSNDSILSPIEVGYSGGTYSIVKFSNCIFVPQGTNRGGASGTQESWIKNYGTVSIDRCRFGSENGGCVPIDNYGSYDDTSTNKPSIYITETNASGRYWVKCYALPSNLCINNSLEFAGFYLVWIDDSITDAKLDGWMSDIYQFNIDGLTTVKLVETDNRSAKHLNAAYIKLGLLETNSIIKESELLYSQHINTSATTDTQTNLTKANNPDSKGIQWRQYTTIANGAIDAQVARTDIFTALSLTNGELYTLNVLVDNQCEKPIRCILKANNQAKQANIEKGVQWVTLPFVYLGSNGFSLQVQGNLDLGDVFQLGRVIVTQNYRYPKSEQLSLYTTGAQPASGTHYYINGDSVDSLGAEYPSTIGYKCVADGTSPSWSRIVSDSYELDTASTATVKTQSPRTDSNNIEVSLSSGSGTYQLQLQDSHALTGDQIHVKLVTVAGAPTFSLENEAGSGITTSITGAAQNWHISAIWNGSAWRIWERNLHD